MAALPSYETLRASGEEPERWMMFLHGILGRGTNWRGFARRFVEGAPSWGAVLVDLRAHGDSRALPPPDDLDACAADLAGLAAALDAPVAGVLGHSFGGKVALAYAADAPDLRAAVVVDSYPGARPERRGSESVLRVIEMLDVAPAWFADRRAFLAHVREAGFSEALARWLSQSLDPLGDDPSDGYEFGLDLDRIRTLLDDYFARDLWPVIDPPRPGLAAHLVVGARSEVFGPEALEETRRLAARHEGVRLHVIEGAGHWVHVDAPDALMDVLREHLR